MDMNRVTDDSPCATAVDVLVHCAAGEHSAAQWLDTQ